ncbi:uncharacterized protein LOC117654466 [Thrips palmi]|uniref:Uncharacterized protein LOC117654466 n=1 Tax=Thrips palmi TaxID=161013 RepID=A0A6P9AF91_THRPL|nr:uncharacterized protein LOC117654466 [Thrips palmi]XP_034257008.1 uncharacterized protein LOC117654466 [Thrips palmi]
MEDDGSPAGQDADETFSDDDTTTLADSETETATLIDEEEDHDLRLAADDDDHADDQADGAAHVSAVLVRAPGAPTSPPNALDVVKVSVTVKGKTQLLELDQNVPLQDVCQMLCAEHGLRWRPDHYALTTVVAAAGRYKAKGAAQFASHKYISELNRHELAHGAELTLVYAPEVFCDHIIARMLERAKHEEWSRALLQLAELSGDTTFVTEFASRPGAVGLVLGVLLAGKAHRLRTREKVWTLRILLCLVRHGTLTGRETALPELVEVLCVLVRAEQGVDADVLESSLRVLTAVSAKAWNLSPVPQLGVVDLVPLLWDSNKPGVQAAALELMNALAAREGRLGPDSAEGRVQVTKTVTSPMVCTIIVQNILCSPVRSNMARQLSQLQSLILQPLKKAMATRASSALQPLDPLVLPRPPPRLLRRKTSAASLLHSRSWCGEEDKDAVRGADGARDRRSLEEESPYKQLSGSPMAVAEHESPYKMLSGSPMAVAEHAALAAPTTASSTASMTASTTSLNFRGSTTSLASVTSTASDISQHSVSSLWTEFADDVPEPKPTLSGLGEECLQYLSSHHPDLARRAEGEEEALHGALSVTAERLVRLLGAELSLCDDGGAWSTPTTATATRAKATAAKAHLYQPLVFAREVPFFHELFCRGLNLLAKTRREMRAKTQRDQDKVLRVVRRQFREALNAQVNSWDQMDRWLSELPYSAVAALWEKECLSAEQDTVLSSPAVQQLRQRRLGDHGVRGAPGLRQLVRQQRLSALRAGTKFRRPGLGRLHRSASKRERAFVWVWLAQRDAALQHAECGQDAADLADVTGTPQAVQLAAVTTVVTGRKCASVYGTRGRKQSAASDLALSLVLDPQESDAGSLDLIAPDVATLEAWADGLNMLLGKEYLSAAVKRDLDLLLDMEVRLQLMELDGVTPPAEPPPVPPPPPDYDFVT